MLKVESIPLAEVVEFERGVVAPSNIGTDTLCLSLEDLNSLDGTVDPNGMREVPKSTKFRFSSDHVLYGKLRPYLRKVARPTTSGVCSTDILPIRPSKRLDRDYLFHFLRSPEFTLSATRAAVGVNLPRISPNVLSTFAIPLPPLSEQRRIAAILDKADELRAKRRAALAKLDRLTQSIFLDMFGDPAQVLTKWPIRKLGPLLDFLTSGSRGWAQYYADSGDLFLRIQNVRRDELLLDDIAYVNAPHTAEAKRTQVEPGDVLLSITADLGRTAVVPEGIGKAYINQHLSILRTKQLVPRFLSAYVASPVGQRQIVERNRHGVKAGLNFDDIRSFIVPLPPFELQHEFSRRVTVVEKLKMEQYTFLTTLDTLFISLQHRAFQGEL